MGEVIRRHPVWTAIVVWFLMVNAIRTAIYVDDSSAHRAWADIAVVGFSVWSIALCWFFHARGPWDQVPEPGMTWIIFTIATSPMVWGAAGVFLGAARWATWLTAPAIAIGLWAWVLHVRRRAPAEDEAAW